MAILVNAENTFKNPTVPSSMLLSKPGKDTKKTESGNYILQADVTKAFSSGPYWSRSTQYEHFIKSLRAADLHREINN